ncbi:hypothetical protein ACLKA6_016092 [Drosophila palustris]
MIAAHVAHGGASLDGDDVVRGKTHPNQTTFILTATNAYVFIAIPQTDKLNRRVLDKISWQLADPRIDQDTSGSRLITRVLMISGIDHFK